MEAHEMWWSTTKIVPKTLEEDIWSKGHSTLRRYNFNFGDSAQHESFYLKTWKVDSGTSNLYVDLSNNKVNIYELIETHKNNFPLK